MTDRPQHRTKYHEFRVAVVFANHWLDLPLWRTWENVTVRRHANFDINDRDGLDGVVSEAIERFQITDADIANSKDSGILMRPIGGVIINHSAIQEDVSDEA